MLEFPCCFGQMEYFGNRNDVNAMETENMPHGALLTN